MAAPAEIATFTVVGGNVSRVTGVLDFSSVTHLLGLGNEAITAGHAAIIDLGGVTGADSSGLALLIEWLSMAKAAGHAVSYQNMPLQLKQLARLGDVEELLLA